MYTRSGSVLVMSIGFVTVIVALAAAFLSGVSGKKTAAQRAAFNSIAYYGVNSAENHAFESLLSSYTNGDNYTSETESWRTDFLARDSGDRPIPVMARAIGSMDTSDEQLSFNSMIFFENPEGASNYNFMRSRWIDLAYYDEDLNPLAATQREEAMFIVRYSVYISNLDGKISVNPDYDVVAYDNTLTPSTQAQAYYDYQQYLDHYSHSLLSIAGSRLVQGARNNLIGNNVAQDIYGTDPVDPIPPMHSWSNQQDFDSTLKNSASNIRAQIAKAFHGKGMQWGGNDDAWGDHYYRHENYNLVRRADQDNRWGNGRLNLMMPGHVHTPAQIRSLNAALYDDHQWGGWEFNRSTQEYWCSHSQGIRPNDPIPHRSGQTFGFHCPWKINLLTAYDEALRSMCFGLSSHMRYIQTGQSKKVSAPLDVFGRYYPDPFPLGLDEGRDVHALYTNFADENATVDGSDFYQRHHRKRLSKIVDPAYANSYWWDIAFALRASTTAAQNAWGFQMGNDGSNYTHYDPQSAGNSNCLIDPSENNTGNMMDQVEAEFLRILGEDLSSPGSGLLSNNSAQSGFFWDQPDMYTSQLATGTNTRGMEYVLNDVRMSVFGSDALDFNGDGYAESTRNGWIDRINTTTHRTLFSWENPYGQRYRFIKQASATAALAGYEWNGFRWDDLSQAQVDDIISKHRLWLDSGWTDGSPIRPFSKTGRLTIEKARFYKAVSHCQVWNNLLEQRMADVTSEVIYILDPNQDSDISDSHIQYRRTHRNLKVNDQ